MTTITDFLLARIAEDEAYASDIPGRSAFVPMPADAEIVVAYPGSYDRMLAEAEAKRRIVMSCSEMQMSGVQLAAYLATQTIRTLALVYAAHPDFREEWR